MKTGIMGGTFDPPHYGHLILAEQTYTQFGLDRLLFIPAGNPPHKPLREGRADNAQRMEFCRRAVEGNPHFTLSDIEMRREGPSYSYLTLEELHAEYPEDEFYFIIGADSLFEFPTWRKPERICELCTLVCAVRNDCGEEGLQAGMERVREEFCAKIERISMPNIDISSQMLRDTIKNGGSVRYFLPDPVLAYIEEQGLYRAEE